MTESVNNKMVVGILGMPDNEGTLRMLEAFAREPDVAVDFFVYWK